jgi:hypothetical protein
MTRLPRTATRTALAAALGVAAGAALGVAVAVSASSAAQANTYRYWTYWKAAPGQSSWGFSPAGASSRPPDGAVEGWRFALSGVAGSSSTQPRATPSFDSICGGTPPVSGGVRVAVVVDFGTSDAQPPDESPPRGVVAYCATKVPTLTGLDALAAGPWGPAVRTSGGLVCGIDGYPRTECGALVSSPTPAPPTPAPPVVATPPASTAASAPQQPALAASRPPSPTPPAPEAAAASQPPGSPVPSTDADASSSAPANAAPGGEPVAAAAEGADPVLAAGADTSRDAPGGPPLTALAGFGLVVGLGGAAWWRMRGER